MSSLNTRIKLKHDTTENWNRTVGFIPLSGEIIIYDDYTQSSVGRNIPGIKIGDGVTDVKDLLFVDKDVSDKLLTHINNSDIHVTLEEKTIWGNKLDDDDIQPISNHEIDVVLMGG